MILSLQKEPLGRYLIRQLDQLFPDDIPVSEIGVHIGEALDRVEYCFSAILTKYFVDGQETKFNHLNSDQYAMFLYFLSNTLYHKGADRRICDKIFCLNKSLHGIDVFYEIELPNIFLLNHCVGTVLGRAIYSDYLLVYQNCTIGASHQARPGEENEYPTIGRYVTVYAGASVLGKCQIGDNCKISAHSVLLDQNLDANTIYIGSRASHLLKVNKSHDNIWNSKA